MTLKRVKSKTPLFPAATGADCTIKKRKPKCCTQHHQPSSSSSSSSSWRKVVLILLSFMAITGWCWSDSHHSGTSGRSSSTSSSSSSSSSSSFHGNNNNNDNNDNSEPVQNLQVFYRGNYYLIKDNVNTMNDVLKKLEQVSGTVVPKSTIRHIIYRGRSLDSHLHPSLSSSSSSSLFSISLRHVGIQNGSKIFIVTSDYPMTNQDNLDIIMDSTVFEKVKTTIQKLSWDSLEKVLEQKAKELQPEQVSTWIRYYLIDRYYHVLRNYWDEQQYRSAKWNTNNNNNHKNKNNNNQKNNKNPTFSASSLKRNTFIIFHDNDNTTNSGPKVHDEDDDDSIEQFRRMTINHFPNEILNLYPPVQNILNNPQLWKEKVEKLSIILIRFGNVILDGLLEIVLDVVQGAYSHSHSHSHSHSRQSRRRRRWKDGTSSFYNPDMEDPSVAHHLLDELSESDEE